MNELKALLGEEAFAALVAKLGTKEITVHEKGVKLIVDDGSLIPKHRLDEVIAARDTFKEQAERAENNLKEIKKAAEGDAKLIKQIDELQVAAKEARIEAQKQAEALRKTFALKEGLLNAGVLDAEARELLSLRFDVSKIELDEAGKVKGLDELIKPLKTNKAIAGMFGEVKMQGQEHGTGSPTDASLGEYAKNNPFSKGSLNITKQVELLRTDRELAERLQKAAV